MDRTSAIPCPRLTDCVHRPGPGHGWSGPGSPGQRPGTGLQEPTLTSSLLRVTPAGKQHARQHGRSIRQHQPTAHQLRSWAESGTWTDADRAAGQDGLGQQPGTHLQEHTRTRYTCFADHAGRPSSTHGGTDGASFNTHHTARQLRSLARAETWTNAGRAARTASGNSPARASRSTLGRATLVLHFTPADQAASAAARTEHSPTSSPLPAGCEHCLGREHRRGYSCPDGTSPQEPTRARGTSAEHASRPRTHGARAARSSATPARRRQPFVHRRQPEAAYHSSARTAPTQSWTRTERCYPADQGSRPISADHIVPRNPHIPYKMYMAFGL